MERQERTGAGEMAMGSYSSRSKAAFTTPFSMPASGKTQGLPITDTVYSFALHSFSEIGVRYEQDLAPSLRHLDLGWAASSYLPRTSLTLWP